jgi:hypothetical protein
MLIKNQNVDIERLNDYIKIISRQNNNTPGIKFKTNVKKHSEYILIANGYKNTIKDGHVKFWIANIKYNSLIKDQYVLSDIDEKYIIKFNTFDNDELYIGLLFFGCIANDYFMIRDIKLFDNSNNIIVHINSNSETNIKKRSNYIFYDKLTETIDDEFEEKIYKKDYEFIDKINTNLLKIYHNPITNNEIEDNTKKISKITWNEEKKSTPLSSNVILIIVDFVYMINNLADSRYKYLYYLAEQNKNIVLAGTGMNFFRQGMHINTLVNTLKIQPKLIIHANNFTKQKLLVAGLREYPCKKILIIEDMHSADLITNLIKYNRFNYVFYHCDCSQLDNIKLLNRNIRFINYPHYIDTNIYKNYDQKKTYDIILYGCINQSVYPFRNRLFNLIHSSKRFKVLYIPFPGYYVKNRNSIIQGKKLSQMINKSYIGIVTSSIHDYFLKKYLEIPASYTMIAGNIPIRYRNILQGNIIELTPNMSDAQIINILETALSDKKKLLNNIDYLHNLISKNFSYENGNETFNDIVNAIN